MSEHPLLLLLLEPASEGHHGFEFGLMEIHVRIFMILQHIQVSIFEAFHGSIVLCMGETLAPCLTMSQANFAVGVW